MKFIGTLLAGITNFVSVLGGLAIALMMFHVAFDVIGRYLFNTPLPGTITIVSYYYMSIAAFIPLAFAEQKDAHISVDVVTERLPPWIRNNLERLALLCSLAVFSLLAARSFVEAQGKYRMSASVVQGDADISIWFTYYMLPVGSGLMALIVLYKLVSSVFGLESALNRERAKADEFDSERRTQD
ncbi:tripartite AtP-independent periplasmic transporter subunit DctQ [Alcanivorax sp. 521-1]|uniref:TRAP transporter small permease protein n=1 Tax=Alloalcanivorax profundimaris TaxID=2735259 RepID=A0ABS0AVT1_9GAMM|nr:TRAP transporter small permease [Alloalcanivorax profundimaris]MBF5058050.1 tripartite AtP-independent periplasmic transporter subunit DctQ [Alloalcanivorax profundimaris]